MLINTEFYGTDAEQIAIDSYRSAIKTPKWTSHGESGVYDGSLYALNKYYNNNASSGTVNLDASIIPWCINANSVILKRKYAFPYTNSDYNGGTQSTPTDNDYSILASRDWKCDSADAIIKSANGYQFMVVGYSSIGTSDIDLDSPPYSPPRNTYNQRYSPYDFANQFLDYSQSKRTRLICAFDYSDTVTTARVACVDKEKYDNIFNDDDTYKFKTNYPFRSADITFYDIQDINNIDLNTQLVIGFQVRLYSGYYNSNRPRVLLNIVPFDGYNAIEFNNIPQRKDYLTNLLFGWSGDSPANWFSIGGILYKFNWGTGSGNNLDVYIGKEYANNIYYTKESTKSYAFKTVSGDCLNSEFIYKQYPRAQRQMTILFKTYNDLGLDGIRNFIMQQLAYLGFWIVDNLTDARTKTTKDNHFYLPLFDDNSVTTGQYKRYDEAQNEKNFAWNENIFEQANYTPIADPNNYDDNKTILNTITAIYDRFTHEYVLNGTQLLQLKNELYTTIASDVDSSFWSEQKFLTNNPLDVVKSLTFYPFDVANAAPNTGTLDFDEIVLGTVNTGVNATGLIDGIVILDCGKCTYFPYYGVDDFRSYAPYSSAELHIPYCGSIDIPPELFLNHTISVKMIVDLKTGSCLALIYRDNMVVDSIGGTVGFTVPISGIERETLAAAEHSALSQYKTARNTAIANVAGFTFENKQLTSNLGNFGIVGAAMSGGQLLKSAGQVANTINSLRNVEDAQYNLQHIETPFRTIGTATQMTSFANEQSCRLIIKRPVMLDGYSQSDFGRCYGFATNRTGLIGDFSGYTQFAAVDLSGVECSETEKAQIKSILLSGVRL